MSHSLVETTSPWAYLLRLIRLIDFSIKHNVDFTLIVKILDLESLCESSLPLSKLKIAFLSIVALFTSLALLLSTLYVLHLLKGSGLKQLPVFLDFLHHLGHIRQDHINEITE